MTDKAQNKHGIKAPEDFEAYFEEWLEYAAWYRNIKSWWPHKNDSNVLWLRYEEIQQDLSTGIHQLLEFLDWNIADEQHHRVLKYCSFKWMKENAERFSRFGDDKEPLFKPGGFIRKGQIGDGKKQLTKEQEQRVLNKARETLQPDCLMFFGINP